VGKTPGSSGRSLALRFLEPQTSALETKRQSSRCLTARPFRCVVAFVLGSTLSTLLEKINGNLVCTRVGRKLGSWFSLKFSPAALLGRSLEEDNQAARSMTRGDRQVFVARIGASADGIAPLREFFIKVKEDSGMAYVVVLHLSPQHESNLTCSCSNSTA
jgi:chemotaxis response regulator CheB